MSDGLTGAYALLGMAAVAFGVILTICWIILPFALIGTKPILRAILAEQVRTNALLERQLAVPVVRETRVVPPVA